MRLPANIQEKVLGGFVLNDQGEWIPVSEKVAKERDFLSHLEAGEVLCNGKWIKIAEAIKIQNNMGNNITEEMPVHYQDAIDNARTTAYMINNKTTQNCEAQENPTFYPPETVCIDSISMLETMPETKLFETIPDPRPNTNSNFSTKESVNYTGIPNQQQQGSNEIQNAISNINELISRKNNGEQEESEEDLISQALNIEDEQQPGNKNRKLVILLIILGIAICGGTAIIVFLLQ